MGQWGSSGISGTSSSSSGSDGSGYVAALAQIYGAQETNRTNVAIADAANNRSAEMSREQMAFQQANANNAHQREVADLRAAGLNPILSVNAGAAAPQGAQGSVTAANVDNALEGLATTALDMQRTKSQIGLQDAQSDNLDMDTLLKSKTEPKAEFYSKGYKAVNQTVDKISERAKTAAPLGGKPSVPGKPDNRPLEEIFKENNANMFNKKSFINPWGQKTLPTKGN